MERERQRGSLAFPSVLAIGDLVGSGWGREQALDVRTAPLAELTGRCREETEKFLRREQSHDTYCYEIFRRAICDRDEQAWAAVFAQYGGMVLAWVRRHPVSTSAREDDAYWVNRTFDRFWSAVRPERFGAFPGMAAVLRYLKMCGHSVLLDEARARRGTYSDVLDDRVTESVETPDVAESAIGELTGSDLWAAIVAETQDEAE